MTVQVLKNPLNSTLKIYEIALDVWVINIDINTKFIDNMTKVLKSQGVGKCFLKPKEKKIYKKMFLYLVLG